ncbi:leucine-rich repeat domain-containing protein [Prevotella sp.]|uniref:leucine-rich repeat domain-containing protein n=1 Tax=Prevotella sp. TaxID=59823 RepID=UPI0027E29351|nr:leucine-rich repeat domain-containing protein [Prevotella sp.]
MMKFLLSKHSRSVFIFALLSLFMCMVAGKASAAELNPVVKIDKTSYTSSGTEVTLRLWMFNWKKMTITTKDYNARFTGDVYLYIDDKEVGKLNEMWGLIAGSNYVLLQEKPGTVGNSSVINLDGTNVGTAQFQDLKSGQTCPYNSNTTENTWRTVDLKLSFNKSFSYYGHKITVKGKWQDQSSGTLVAKDVALDNDINGFVRPVNLSAQPSGDNMVFSWEQEGYNPSASTLGKWIVYKREGDNNVKLGEAAANEHSLSIEKKQYSCSKDYIMTFLPNVCEGEETVCGLTTTIAATGHKPNADEICQMCGHSFFRYQTSNGKIVDISNKNFGAKVVAHEVVDGKCVIEFDAPITQIPEYAFNKCDNLTGNLVIPNTVTEIGVSAFSECKNLTGALILPNSVTKIGNGAFRSCSGFTTLKLSETLSVIPDHAFYNCSSLSGKLIIPNSVTTIGNWAFNSCRGFTEGLTIPNSVTTIGNSAFYNCSGFTGDLTISNSVTTIGNSAFYNCYRFTGNLTIPNSVTTIGNFAFSYCTGFTGDLSLPKSLEVVGSRSFEFCNKIQTIKFQSLPEGISGYLGVQNKTVSLSDDSYISDMASGTVNEISYTRKMSSDWGTLVLPYPLTLTGNEPYRLYSIDNMTGEELVLKQLEGVVAAGTPCVVKRNGSEAELTFGNNKAKLNMAINDQPMDGMKFSGTYWTKDVTDGDGYIIAKDCFWNVADLQNSESVKGVKVKPFRAWLDGTSANAPARLSMRIDDNTTGINATEVLDALNDAEAEYYDLSGKRLDEPQKGVNIVRMKSGKTKKIIIK